jgi:hypothetical protein
LAFQVEIHAVWVSPWVDQFLVPVTGGLSTLGSDANSR